VEVADAADPKIQMVLRFVPLGPRNFDVQQRCHIAQKTSSRVASRSYSSGEGSE
jgi:hypothetical protein